jgi:hypothetical protein
MESAGKGQDEEWGCGYNPQERDGTDAYPFILIKRTNKC